MKKQKQIEEIAKELCPHYADGKCYYETNEVSTCDCECEFCWAVSVLLKAGYRKIPENAVVLTMEEHNKLRVGNYKLESLYKQYPYRVLVGFNSMVFSQDHENYEKLFDDIEKRIAEGIRKETAEKFAERLKLSLDKNDLYVYSNDDIDEICKEITGVI